MKTIVFCSMITLFLLPAGLSAQSAGDSAAIKKACLDYVEGWATGELERIEKGLSPELVKRTIGRDKDGLCFTSNMSRSQLAYVSKSNRGGVKAPDLEPSKPYKPEVTILDIAGDYASVKVISAKYGFFDYCQMAKFNGEWLIINVLWGPEPAKK